MGTSKRYPHHAGQLAEERHLREAVKAGPLRGLTREQVRYGSVPLTTVPKGTAPVWGVAWLRFGDVEVRSTVRINRWTPNAVDVTVEVDGAEQRCWIWKGACDPLRDRRDAW